MDPYPFRLRYCFIKAVKGVVIGQPDDVEPDGASLTHELARGICPVGDQGVSMQVDPHTFRPITLPGMLAGLPSRSPGGGARRSKVSGSGKQTADDPEAH